MSHVHFVHYIQDDLMLLTDLGYDHLYTLDLNDGFEIVYNFSRGLGPRHFAIDS